MGVLNGNELCKELCEKSKLPETATCNKPIAHLLIDGPILLYCGNVPKPPSWNCTETKFALYIIRKKIDCIIEIVKTYYDITHTKIFFDGEAPKEKAPIQNQRAQRISTYNIQEIKKEFCEQFRTGGFTIINLTKGEAEMEMYRQRDVNVTNIIYTKDTDLFTIAYKHSGIDDVIYYQERCINQTKVHRFFDMRKFYYEHIPKDVFSALMALAGTDYTDTRLSLTQLGCILNENAVLSFENISDDPNIDDIQNIIDKITDYFQSKPKHGSHHAKRYNLITEHEYLEKILWYVRYIKYGFPTY